MLKIKRLRDFSLFEGVNDDLIQAKADVNSKLAEISQEIAKQKEGETVSEKAASVKKQAALYGQMSILLNKLATSMMAKEAAGDNTNIY